MSDIKDLVRGVLDAHPLTDGEGFYVGSVVCEGCHHVLGDPAAHILEALTEVLDPHRPTPVPAPTPQREDPRESSIVWEAS